MHSTYAAHVLIHGTTSITGLLPGRLFFKVLKSWKWQFSVFQGSLLVSLAQSPRHQLLVLLLLSCFHCVRLCATSSMAAHQAPCPWDSPGKNTGVGCHFLLQCMKVKVKSLSHAWLLATPWTAAHQVLCPWDFLGKSTEVGCHYLLRGHQQSRLNQLEFISHILPTYISYCIYTLILGHLLTR